MVGADNFNEVRFEDDKGKELLFFQAEKDHELKVKHNQKDTIENDRLTTIANNDTLDVGNILKMTAGSEIEFKTGGASIKMTSDGSITIKGTNIKVQGTDIKVNGTSITMKAPQIKLN